MNLVPFILEDPRNEGDGEEMSRVSTREAQGTRGGVETRELLTWRASYDEGHAFMWQAESDRSEDSSVIPKEVPDVAPNEGEPYPFLTVVNACQPFVICNITCSNELPIQSQPVEEIAQGPSISAYPREEGH